MGSMTQDEINSDLFDEVKRLQKENRELKEIISADLLELFYPMVFNSVKELDKKIKDLNVDIYDSDRPFDRLRSFAGHRFRQENVSSALYYLKMERLVGEELEIFLNQDFQEVKKDFYTWKNGNISALFVVEFID
jgi:hypothetical protein